MVTAMSDELATDFFKSARSQMDQTVRWHLIILAALLYLDVGIVRPYVGMMAEKAAVTEDIKTKEAIRNAIAPAREGAKALAVDVADRVKTVSTGLVDDLKARFGQLDMLISQISQFTDQEALLADQKELDPETILKPLLSEHNSATHWQMQSPMQAPIQTQMQLPEPELLITQPVPGNLATFLVRQGREYGSASTMTDELDAYVQAAVIMPAFDQANAQWQQQADAIQVKGQKAIEAIRVAREKLSDPPKSLTTLEASIEGLNRVAGELHLTPPGNTGWWRTVPGKVSSVYEMMQMVQHGIGEANTAEASLAKIQEEIEAAMAIGDKLARDIDQSVEALNRQATELQAQLGKIGGPLGVVSFGLATLAPLLPAIIAAASGICLLLTVRALHRMRLAVERATTEEGRNLLQPWLLDTAGRNTLGATLWALAVTLSLVVWIGWVAWEVRTLPVPLLSPLAILALSIFVIVGIRLWLWWEAILSLRVRT